MHPVTEHLLARRGKNVPINDGRKIALVLYGGLMTGIRGAGALMALVDLGLGNAFDYIYTASAGFPNASYMLSGNGRLGSSIYYDELTGSRFLNFLRLWNVADIDYIIDVVRNKKKLNLENIWNAKTKFFVRLQNLQTKQPEYLEIHSYKPEQYFDIFKAAVSIPYLQPGAIKISGVAYKDGDFTDRDSVQHLDYVLKTDATDIVVIYNRFEHRQNNLPPHDRILEICPEPEWPLSRFETRPERLKFAWVQMGNLVKQTFGDFSEISLEPFENQPAYAIRN
jgi:predicted patatin/cPLA2 family phospholipase